MIIHLYGLIVGLAIVVGVELASRIYVKWGGKRAEIEKILLWVVGGGILGARIYHVVDYSSYYHDNLWQIFALWNGGLGIWGGIGGGIAAFTIYYFLFYKKVDYWKVLAAMMVAMPLSQAIGRIANGVNGEFGEKVLRMPWWSVEMMLNLMLFGVMWLVQLKPRGRTSRVLVGMYLVGYGLIRLVMESFRERSWEVMGLGVAQWAAMLSIVVGLSIWYKAARD